MSIRRIALFLVSFFLLLAGADMPSAHAQGNVVDARRAQLEKQLAEYEARIQELQKVLTVKQGERVSLERDVAILDAQIEKAQLAIRARDLVIEKLTGEIGNRSTRIGALDEKLAREKESLAQLVRKTNEIDEISMVEVILGNHTFTEFFEELDDYRAIKGALHQSFDAIAVTRADTQAEKQTLESKREEERELRTLQELEKQQIEEQEAEKERILESTRGQEAAYQNLIAQNEQSAAQIRAALFELRGSAAIPFGDAYEYAMRAQQATGVRAALILGILKQETKLGEFLGNGNWQVDMHPTRDRPLFQVIAATLGFNPASVPVSAAPGYGWGGAMGPGQFIPSTWACYGGYINQVTGDCANSARSLSWDSFWAGPWKYDAGRDRIRTLLGKGSPSNPYAPADAFMATATLMKDNGADRGGFANERLAALRYFAGWANANNPSYAFYGDSVMEHAAYYQKQIDILASAG